MIKVGVTGGIGAGKSFVCSILEQWGYPVFNSDTKAKEIMVSSPKVIRKVKKHFGENAYNNNQINREYLADQIFNHPVLKDKLNSIVHPEVIKSFDRFCTQTAHQSLCDKMQNIVFNEAAILFETGRYKDFDFTVLVTAPEEIRLQRILKRDKTSIEKIKARMNNQWSDDKKRPLASFEVNNDGKSDVAPQLTRILKQISSIG